EIAGRDRLDPELLRESEAAIVDEALLVERVRLDLEVEVLLEELAIPRRLGPRLARLALGERHRDRPLQAARERDQALVVPGEQIPRHARTVVVALEARDRG